MITISKLHKEQFSDMRKRLVTIGSRESTFTSVEILFYDALAIARSYGPGDNPLLQSLECLKSAEYTLAMGRFARGAQRERAIKRFITKFKCLLGNSIKDTLVSSPAV